MELSPLHKQGVQAFSLPKSTVGAKQEIFLKLDVAYIGLHPFLRKALLPTWHRFLPRQAKAHTYTAKVSSLF